MYFSEGNPDGVGEVPPEYFDRDKFLVYIGPSERGYGSDIIRLPKGSWDVLDALVPKILKHNSGPIVEIGMGESTTIFAAHALRYEVKLYSCDIIMGGMFRVFDAPLFGNHECIIGKSEDFIKEFNDEPAIVFIDGEHTYEAVKREVDFFLPIMKENGVMFLHDTFPTLKRHIIEDKFGRRPGTIYKVRQELERNPDVDVFTWPYSAMNMGMTMVMKHPKNEDRSHWLQNGRFDDKQNSENTP